MQGVPLIVINGKYTTDVGMAGGPGQLLSSSTISPRARSSAAERGVRPCTAHRPRLRMLSVFVPQPQAWRACRGSPAPPLPKDAIWFDLLEPSPEEERAVEQVLGIDVPTREEMREIESSNRLYEENGGALHDRHHRHQARYGPAAEHAGHVHHHRLALVTNRYTDPLPFRRFVALRGDASGDVRLAATLLLAGLLEAIINRIADVIERVAADLDATSAETFASARAPHRAHRWISAKC